jgi:hypothetical protein
MKKVITTFGLGPMSELLDVSLPTFARYAQAHGYDLFVPSGAQFTGIQRHPSWFKVPLIMSLLKGGYDTVLWIDADVVVRKYDRDIVEGVESPMGMVVQNTSDGAVPSCGVWMVRQAAMEFLQSLWPLDGFARSGCWWEQAAVIAALGGDPDATPVSVPNGWWAQLPYEFNPHIGDPRGIYDCRFFHATGFADRLTAMKEALA